jgi:NADH-quinone oxidoreductase subunit H
VLSSIAVYGIMLAGWSSGSKYPLLGSVRATAQMVSYEAALGLSMAGVILVSGTLSTSGIVTAQSSLSKWSLIATGFLPFVVFLVAATAELNRPPFDLVEAEQELVGGFNTEYTGIRFAIFFLAEFMNVITMSAIATTLFLGGPSGPGLGFLGSSNVINVWLMPVFWFTAKVLGLLFVTVWLRATLPRMRYDRLMALGWKYLIEIAILWVLVSVALLVGHDQNWNPWITGPVAAGIALIAFLALYLAIPKAGERVEEFR